MQHEVLNEIYEIDHFIITKVLLFHHLEVS